MKEFILYSDDGRILSSGGYSNIFSEERISGFYPDNGILFVSGMDGISTEGSYVASGVIEDRIATVATWDKTSVIANGIDEAILSGLPIPCTLYVDGIPVVVNDGSFEFSANAIGDYIVRIDEVGYLAREWTIDAN